MGAVLIPTRCLREEGTSLHDFPEVEVTLSPDERLVELLRSTAEEEGANVVTGLQWTIDAPYRELQGKITSFREQGVVGVDMETSAMYALGLFRGVSVCNLLVVSDELWGEWRPALRTPELEEATRLAQHIHQFLGVKGVALYPGLDQGKGQGRSLSTQMVDYQSRHSL